MIEETLPGRSITSFVELLKKGDRYSLYVLRERLGCSRAELAGRI
jgi:biotin operon repressor